MTIDPGVAIGVAGALLAGISILYTRTQAIAQRRQVEEMQRQTEHIRRAQHFEASQSLMREALCARHEWMKHFRPEWVPQETGPQVREILKDIGSWEAFSCVRTYVDHLQAAYFARKADMIADDHWLSMHGLFRGFFTPEIDRALFERLINLRLVTDEFAKFGRDYMSTRQWVDPLGRLAPIDGNLWPAD